MPPASSDGSTVPQWSVLALAGDVPMLDLLEAALARLPGVQVIGALQGRLGLELARAHHPQLILLALDLPDLPGTTVLQQLRGDARTQAIPVITHGDAASQGRRLAGTAGHLTLPTEIARVAPLVRALLP
jgi:DNA-binding response OmpR family regulator